MKDEEFYKLSLDEQLKIFALDNSIGKSPAKRYAEFMKHAKKNNIPLGETVNYRFPEEDK